MKSVVKRHEDESYEEYEDRLQREARNKLLQNFRPECERYQKLYQNKVGRKPAVYKPSVCLKFGLPCSHFWVLGTYLHELLHSKRQPLSTEVLPPVRRLVGPQSSFTSSDAVLLFCLSYCVEGYSQQQLAEKYKCTQALISLRLKTVLPYFRAAVRLCCTQDHRDRSIVGKLKQLARANAAAKPQLKHGRRGPVFDLAAFAETCLSLADEKSKEGKF